MLFRSRRAIREVAILEGLHHPAIVRLHEVFQISDNSLAIVMEACSGARALAGLLSSAIWMQGKLDTRREALPWAHIEKQLARLANMMACKLARHT